jgi:phosphoglucosamine mutase
MGKATRVEDAAGRYIEFCKGTVPFGTLFQGLKLVVDCAHGSCYRVGPAVLRELGAELVVIGNTPDGLNINDGFGSTDTAALREAVLKHGADAGIAFDGDGDRVVMLDAAGETVDGDDLLYIIARSRQHFGTLRGGVVGTVMSNLGLELALKEHGIPFVRTRVGDRYIHRELVERGWMLGGEASGHVLVLDRTSTGDGIISALQVLEVMVRSGRPLADVHAEITKFPQTMINVPIAAAARERLGDSERIRTAVNAVETRMNGRGRVILRPSGTEPLIRVTLEGEDADLIDTLANELAEVVRSELA